MVTEFLKFARPLVLADEEVSFGSLAPRVIDELRESQPGVSIALEGEFTEISGDEGLLRQALLNLVRNAAEAAAGQPFGGRVTIRGSVEQSGSTFVQRISISDNGPGIPSENLSKIFVPFYTTKAQGTGLGLAIVQKIIVQHGGTVEARNLLRGRRGIYRLAARTTGGRAAGCFRFGANLNRSSISSSGKVQL